MMANEGLFPSYLPGPRRPVLPEPQEYFGGQPVYELFAEQTANIPPITFTTDNAEASDIVANAVVAAVLNGADPATVLQTPRSRSRPRPAARSPSSRGRHVPRGARAEPGDDDAPSRALGQRLQRPGAWFALPAALLLAVFFTYPLASSLWQSFFATSGGVTPGSDSSSTRASSRTRSSRKSLVQRRESS